MPSGGPRQGTPGASYTNRTDLNRNRQPVKAASGQAYGKRKEQEDAQQAVPLPNRIIPLTAPTQRPDEPVTAGVPAGPGPGPEALVGFDPQDDIRSEILHAYRMTGEPQLLEALRLIDEGF